MRRALFGTGFPQSVPDPVGTPITNPDGCLQVMDLRNTTVENQSRTRFITLFAWPSTAGGVAEIYVQVGDQTPYFVGALHAFNDITNTDPSSMRLQIRGNVRVIAGSAADGASVVFGYFEMEDNLPSMEIVRPLQPSSPISPFTVVPLPLTTSESATLHAFEEDYTDAISIDYFVFQTVVGAGVVTFTFPNGVPLITKEIGVTSGQINILSGIPMLPSAAGQVITVTADADIASAAISGTFVRG